MKAMRATSEFGVCWVKCSGDGARQRRNSLIEVYIYTCGTYGRGVHDISEEWDGRRSRPYLSACAQRYISALITFVNLF